MLLKVRRLTAEAEAGRLSRDRAPTLAAWLDRYLSEVASTTVRPSTLHRYRHEVRLYIGPELGKVPIDQLRPAQVSRFHQDQLRRLSPGSVRRLHALLRRSLRVAVRWQLIQSNPVIALDPPAIASVQVDPYTMSEARAFLAAIRGERFEVRWVLAITLGLRQGEVLDLAWRDVDLDHAVLRVHRENYDHERQLAGEFWEDWGLIFTTHVGTPLSPRNDYRTFGASSRVPDSAG